MTRRNWIAVACAEHVRRGVSLGFMQACHGKGAPLRRIAPGDRIAYYSPATTMGGTDRLQSFTALGIVRDGAVYRADMGGDFQPFRRDVRDLAAQSVPAATLVGRPGFALSGAHWGAKLRFGLLAVDDASMDMISGAMMPNVSRD